MDEVTVPLEIAEIVAEQQRFGDWLSGNARAIQACGDLLCSAFAAGGRVYTFGNGGSAAEAQHFAAELVGHFRRIRRPLPAVALTADPSVMTCIGNDFDFEQVFARQAMALVRADDVVVAFTTSGRSANVVSGLAAARSCGATTVLLAAGSGADARDHADYALLVPSGDTARIQEMHLILLHLLSEVVDRWAMRTDLVRGGRVPEYMQAVSTSPDHPSDINY